MKYLVDKLCSSYLKKRYIQKHLDMLATKAYNKHITKPFILIKYQWMNKFHVLIFLVEDQTILRG